MLQHISVELRLTFDNPDPLGNRTEDAGYRVVKPAIPNDSALPPSALRPKAKRGGAEEHRSETLRHFVASYFGSADAEESSQAERFNHCFQRLQREVEKSESLSLIISEVGNIYALCITGYGNLPRDHWWN